MKNLKANAGSTIGSTNGTLLYVTDLDNDSGRSLDLASDLAIKNGIRLEMIHVVDLHHSYPGPDGQMGIQFRLDALARTPRLLKRSVTSILMFGSPEDVVARRAQEIHAKLVAFPNHGQRGAAAQQAMVKRVSRKVACPVVVLAATNTSALEG